MNRMKIVVITLMLISIGTTRFVNETNQKGDDPYSSSNNSNEVNPPTRMISSNCVCVPYFNCLTDGHVNVYGVSIIKPRGLGIDESDTNAESEVVYCPKITDVCCIVDNNATIITDLPIEPPKAPTSKVGCGIRNFGGVSGRITRNYNNQLTNESEFPWIVYIYRKETIQNKNYSAFKCTGTLINEKVVLTSAQCIYKIKNLYVPDLRVRVGDWNLRTTTEKYPHFNFEIDWIYIHPQFAPSYLEYDFALITLRNPATFTKNIQNVCLPDSNVMIESEQCYIIGWGTKNSGNSNQFPSILKAISVPTVPSDKCQARYKKLRLRLHESLLCAGGIPGHNTCESDTGSPLVCPLRNNPKRYVQAGIIAWSFGCNNKYPAIFANVSAARPWIDAILKNDLKILPTSYTPSTLIQQ